MLTETIAVSIFQYAPLIEDTEGLENVVHFAPFTNNPGETPSEGYSVSRHRRVFTVLLLALALPSLWTDIIPNPTYTTTTTPFSLGCVLLQTHLPHTKPHTPTLQDYIDETKKMSHAKLIFWPEGVLKFDKEEEQNKTFEIIAHDLLKQYKGLHIGLGFEEYATEPQNNRASKHNRIALPIEDKIFLQYYKCHLVPGTSVSELMMLEFELT